MHDESITRNKGFSLLELTCAMAILLVVGGAALYGLAVYQRSYSGTSVRQNMQSSVRTATELLQQEIGQAGAFTGLGGNPSVTIAATISTGVQNVTLPAGYTSNMWVGEKLQVDLGANQETVAITAISGNVITATFTNSHPAPGNANTVISFAGIFPNGILSTSDGTHLYIIGDVNGDGNLYYVAYTCTQSNTPPNYGTLMRSITLLPNNTAAQADTLVQNVTLNPDASACFSYQPTASITVSGTTYTSVSYTHLTLPTNREV